MSGPGTATEAASSAVDDRAARGALPTLTVLRGAAALTVFALHAAGELLFRSQGTNERAVALLAGPGTAAVACFFVLSGFILVWVARPTDAPRAFWRRRIAKVYPLHAVTWVAGLVLIVAAGRAFNLLALLPSLALVQVWLPHPAVFEGTNGPAWTLACEAFFYALFPLLAALVARIPSERLVRWVAALIAGILAYTVLVALVVPTEPRTTAGLSVPAFQMAALVFLPPIRLVEFVLGMVLARAVIDGRWPAVGRGSIVAVGAAGYACSLVIPAPLGYLVPFLPVIVLGIGAAARSDLRARAGRRRDARLLVWLGETSFAFYLVHWLVLRNLRIVLGDGPWAAPSVMGYVALTFVISLALAHLLHVAVEVPVMRRWSTPRRPALPVGSPFGTLASPPSLHALPLAAAPASPATSLAVGPLPALPDRAAGASAVHTRGPTGA